jgi:hypothetical protein
VSLTISTIINGTLTLVPSNNPVTILGTGGVQATAAGADAIDGDSSTAWMISNAGTISSASGFGLYLNGPSSNLSNSGSISGAGGMFLNNDGSVMNTATGTITATGTTSSLAIISGIYVSGAGIGAISVTNAGVITAPDGYGVGLGQIGSVNNSGTVTGGEDGVLFSAGGNLQNSGSITATVDDGVGMFQGGTVTNAAGASISGVAGVDGAGIYVTGGAATITNNGQVNGFRYGILVSAGGTVTNSSTGTIKGQGAGVGLNDGGMLSNSGAISSIAAGSAAADLELGGTINNLQGATLTGGSFGAFISGASGSVVNSGTISSAGSFGVSINGGGTVQNNATGSITGNTAGVNIANQSATVINSGLIKATGSGSAAIETNTGGSVTNNAGGTISAVAFGFFASASASATFSNAGTVTASKGVGLYDGGSVVNLAGGQLIGQSNAGVFISGAAGAVSNSGAISVSAQGWPAIDLEAGGSVTNNAGGTITGTAFAIYDLGGSSSVSNAAGASMTSGSVTIFMRGDGNKVTNSGTITSPFNTSVELYGNGDVVTNTAGATISAGAYAVFLGGPGTVENLGSLSGGSYAVDFSVNSSANLLQVGAGATFTGSVNGDGGAIELLSGGAGTIGGISNSGQFWGFQSLNADAGGAWTLTGSDAIANVINNGALSVNGSLDVTSALNAASTGAFDLGAGGILEVASATGAQTAMDFLGASQLVVDNAALFGTGVGGTSYLGSQLENFGAGDSIDLHNFSASGATPTYNSSSGLLQLSSGGALATLDFQQSTLGGTHFSLAADASGSGLLITRT